MTDIAIHVWWLAFAIAAAVRCTTPTRTACPPGWYVANLKPSGVFVCEKATPPDVCNTKAGCSSTLTMPRVRGSIYCTNGTIPVTDNDGRAVGCQRVRN